jgi:hypothetical protein
METPCVVILNKQKCHFFFFYKIREQEAEQVLPGGVDTSVCVCAKGGRDGERAS